MTIKRGWGIADLHQCPERAQTVYQVLDYLEEEAKIENPEFLIIAGDLLHKALLNTDSHGIPEFRRKLNKLSKSVPILLIYGTPSHDAVGSLEIFECSTIRIVRPGIPFDFNGIRFYSIPEPSKKAFAGQGNSLIKAGQDLNEVVRNLCISYGVDRQSFDGPTIAIGHGVVKSLSTEENEAVKRSSNYLTESELSKINADAYIWGDIHYPFDFEEINGGYCGSFAYSWNELNYKPSFMELSISGSCIDIKRKEFPFIPERVKISSDAELRCLTLLNKRVWLEIPENESIPNFNTDDMSLISGCIKDCSKYTIKKDHKKIIRSEDIMKVKNYDDMYTMYNPDATSKQLLCCREIYDNDLQTGVISQPRVIKPIYVKVRGLKPFLEGIGKDEIEFRWDELEPGIIGLVGPGGMGKSTLMDISKPFIELLTQPNNFTSLFEGNDAFWETSFKVNDDEITLKAFIKASNKTPTAEYYAYKNGEAIPECTKNRDPFCDFVYKTFGSPRLFATTVFRTQFDNPATWKGSPLNPSLINAGNSTLKALVHEFSGTDKDSALSFSKTKRISYEKESSNMSIRLDGFLAAIPNQEELIELRKSKRVELKSCKYMRSEIVLRKETLSSEIESIEIEANKSKLSEDKSLGISEKITSKNIKINELKRVLGDSENIPEQVKNLHNEILELEELRTQFSAADIRNTSKSSEYSRLTTEYGILSTEYFTAKREYDSFVSSNKNAIRDCESQILNNNNLIISIKRKIQLETDPCEKCGHVKQASQERIDNFNSELEVIDKTIIELEDKKNKFSSLELSFSMTPPKEPQKPILEPVDNSIQFKIDSANKQIFNLNKKQSEMNTAEIEIQSLYKDVEELKDEFESLKVDIIPFISASLTSKRNDMKSIEDSIITSEKAISSLFEQIKSCEGKLSDIEKQISDAASMKMDLESMNSLVDLWRSMEKAWGRDGIPAMILENISPAIDEETNSLLDQYYPGIMIQTTTLRPDSTGKNMIEDFQINIINNETGRTKPINCLSGEERNFVLVALYSAFRKMNEEKTGLTWEWGLYDEIDSNVSEINTPAFWDLVEAINEGTARKTLCISHSSESKARFQKTINIEAL